jgi:hypothetical protein
MMDYMLRKRDRRPTVLIERQKADRAHAMGSEVTGIRDRSK